MSWDLEEPMAQHALGEPTGLQALYLEVFKHGPGPPAAHHLGHKGVHSSPNEGNTSSITEGSYRNVFRVNTHRRANGPGRGFESVGKKLGCNVLRLVLCIVVGVQWSIWRGSVLAQQ